MSIMVCFEGGGVAHIAATPQAAHACPAYVVESCVDATTISAWIYKIIIRTYIVQMCLGVLVCRTFAQLIPS